MKRSLIRKQKGQLLQYLLSQKLGKQLPCWLPCLEQLLVIDKSEKHSEFSYGNPCIVEIYLEQIPADLLPIYRNLIFDCKESAFARIRAGASKGQVLRRGRSQF